MLKTCEIVDYLNGIGAKSEVRISRARNTFDPIYTAISKFSFADILGPDSLVALDPTDIEFGTGAGRDPEPALIAAAVEAYERFFLRNVVDPATQICSDLPEDCDALSSYGWLSDFQLQQADFPFRNLDAGKVDYWTSLDSLTSDDALFVPASLVWVRRFPDTFYPTTSTGVAAHTDRELCKLSGILEIIERDAFSIFWESRSVAPVIAPDSKMLPPETRRLLETAEARGLKVIMRDLTTDLGVPVVLAVVVPDSAHSIASGPALGVGAAARLSIGEAIEKAVVESLQTWFWMDGEIRTEHSSFEESLEQAEIPDEMHRHPRVYAHAESLKWCENLLCPHEESPRLDREDKHHDAARGVAAYGSAAERVEGLLHYLEERGHSFYGRSLVPDNLDLAIDVQRIFCPTLVPLAVGRYGKPMDHDRLSQVPVQMGWACDVDFKSKTPVPHPFP